MKPFVVPPLPSDLDIGLYTIKEDKMREWILGAEWMRDACKPFRDALVIAVEALEHYQCSHYTQDRRACVHDETSEEALTAIAACFEGDK